MIKTQKLGLLLLFVAGFLATAFLLATPVKADQAGCEASGGTWYAGYNGSTFVTECRSCPAGTVTSFQLGTCIGLPTQCENSGGVWVADQNTCSQCPAGTQLSTTNLSCVPIPQNTSSSGPQGGSDSVTLESDLDFGESGSKIFGYLQTAVNLLTALAGLAITGSVIFAGIQYSAAGGNPQATSKAKTRIINSFVALLALVFLFAFFQWLVPGGIFG